MLGNSFLEANGHSVQANGEGGTSAKPVLNQHILITVSELLQIAFVDYEYPRALK